MEPKSLLTPREVAQQLGVSDKVVRTWMRRADHPLPSIQVGESNRYHRVVADQIPRWLAEEAARKSQAQ